MKNLICIIFLFVFVSAQAQTPGKIRDIYDFEIGDIFHFKYESGYSLNVQFIGYDHIKIIGKYYSSAADTLFYIRERGFAQTYPTPDYNYKIDTVAYPNLDTILKNIDTIFNDPTVFNGRTVNIAADTGFDSGTDNIYIYGCGKEYHTMDPQATYMYIDLIYFKKGNEEWGVPDYTGIDQKQKYLEISLFPNPSNGLLTFVNSENKNSELLMTVYNVQGQIVRKETLFQLNNRIDLRLLPPDVYFVQITSENKTFMKKILIE